MGNGETYDDYIRSLSRQRKTSLVATLDIWARNNGRRWVVNGPHLWSKDELISALGRIQRGEEP